MTSASPFLVTADALDAAAVSALVTASGEPGLAGAVATFVGIVRRENAGRRVVRLEYDAYEPLALRAFERIAAEVAAAWPSVRLAARHRTGSLVPGEASIVIAAASPHRAEAFEACRYTIERVKQVLPVWKREVFDGGEVWIEGATADPDDEAARDLAWRRARGDAGADERGRAGRDRLGQGV